MNMRKWIIRSVVTVCIAAAAAYCLLSYSSVFLYTHEAVKGHKRFSTLDAARPSAPYLSDFLRLFPSAEVNYRYFGSRSDEPSFHVTVDLHERYEFHLFLPAVYDSSRHKVIGYDEPKFQILEVASVKSHQGRTGVVSFNPAGQREFSAADWGKIVESGGDFGSIGYPMITNQRVIGFKYRSIERQP